MTARTTPTCASTRSRSDLAYRKYIVRYVFKVEGRAAANKAIAIGMCESGLRPHARNGQYWGAWQVSAALRKQYKGFGRGLWKQAYHVRRIYRASGRRWTHWIGFGCA